MLEFKFERLGTILCLGAHADDIEIGAGATLLKLRREYPAARVVWVTFSAKGPRVEEARRSAAAFLGEGDHEIIVHDFTDGHFPVEWREVKSAFEALKRVEPDVVLTHYGKDYHQDHRVLSELAWNTFRDHPILEYEIPKYDGGLGSPNVFMPVSAEDVERKIALLMECFPTQASKDWFDDVTFRGLMRLRGLECRAPSGYAEAFYGRKISIG